MPFPQEHPYTSHISRFAVFPDTFHPQPPDGMVDAWTQTGSPPPLYQVSQKAVERGQRVECHYLSVPRDISVKSGAGTLLWDLPRSQRHKVHVHCNSYSVALKLIWGSFIELRRSNGCNFRW